MLLWRSRNFLVEPSPLSGGAAPPGIFDAPINNNVSSGTEQLVHTSCHPERTKKAPAIRGDQPALKASVATIRMRSVYHGVRVGRCLDGAAAAVHYSVRNGEGPSILLLGQAASVSVVFKCTDPLHQAARSFSKPIRWGSTPARSHASNGVLLSGYSARYLYTWLNAVISVDSRAR